jgi:hypothetical protein
MHRLVLDWKLTPVVYAYEKESDLHQSIYPEGFYEVAHIKRTLGTLIKYALLGKTTSAH